MDVALSLLLGENSKRVRGLGEGGKAIHPELEWSDFFLGSKGGLKMRSKKVLKKWFRRVPKWTPKVDQNRQKGCFGGVSKRDLKNGPSPGSGKVRFCFYVLHFSKVGGFKKDTFLGTALGPFGRQNR